MRDTGRSNQAAGAFVLDALEPRRLFSDASGIAVIDWQGQQVEMRQGEWIVGLTPPGSTLDEETGEWKFNGVSSRSTTPSASLKAALEAAEHIGIHFEKYLGSEDVFLVQVPEGVSYEQLVDVLDDIPDFQQVEPNSVIRIDDLPAVPYEGPHVDPDIVPVDLPTGSKGPHVDPDIVPVDPPTAFITPARIVFSDVRIGVSEVLDGDADTEDDLLA